MKIKSRIAVLFLSSAVFVTACGSNQTDTAETAKTDQPPSTQISKDSLVALGRHLVIMGGCNDCHTPLKMTPQGPGPDMSRMLSGHPSGLPLAPVDPTTAKNYVLFSMTNTSMTGPWGTSFSANITSDETGIGNWTEDQFFTCMREGFAKGMKNERHLLPPMPWRNYAQASDLELKAIFAYLKSTPPISNRVPAPIAPGSN